MQFSATYFDGISSASHEVNIYTNHNEWKISIADQNKLNEFSKTIIWKTNSIKKSEVYTKDLVAFTYGNTFPFQRIESSDKEFIKYVNHKKEFSNQLDVKLHKSIGKSITFLLSGILSFSLILYFWIFPFVAVNFAKNLAKENVITFGNYVYNNLANTLHINEEQSEKLQDFVNTLHIKSEFPIRVKVSTSNQLNAFAISGGTIVVYSGLLEKIESEHQLTALIGHEVSHIEERHILKNLARDISGSIFFSIIFGDANGVTSILKDNAHRFSQLSFSRSLEKEADLFGLELMKYNHLDLNGMHELFEILKEETSAYTPKYLSSHPILDDRIKYSKEIADKENNIVNNSLLKEKWNILKHSLD